MQFNLPTFLELEFVDQRLNFMFWFQTKCSGIHTGALIVQGRVNTGNTVEANKTGAAAVLQKKHHEKSSVGHGVDQKDMDRFLQLFLLFGVQAGPQS